MKKFLLIIISALCVLSLVSCDGANNDNNDTVISEVSIPGSSASASFGNANSDNNDTTTSEVSAPESAAASYEVVTWERRDYLTVSVGVHKGDVVPDEQTAVAVAQAIFDNSIKNKYVDYKNCTRIMVSYDSENGVWVVSFSKTSDNPNEYILGGGYSIAIQKSDGKVLKMWASE